MTEPMIEAELCIAGQNGARLARRAVPAGSTIEAALAAFGRPLRPGEGLAVWGRRAELSDAVRAGDRIEIAAPLLVDPKEARRRRAAEQGDVRVVTCGRHGSRRQLKSV